MDEVFAHPEQIPHWQAVAAGRPVVWDDVFAGYRPGANLPPPIRSPRWSSP
jgi:hypothetical protein